uniref:Uncharacterized protein n=1 Tax=Arundo donax TaxID=35708 RepID=A0A0A9GGH1_ARUDO
MLPLPLFYSCSYLCYCTGWHLILLSLSL